MTLFTKRTERDKELHTRINVNYILSIFMLLSFFGGEGAVRIDRLVNVYSI